MSKKIPASEYMKYGKYIGDEYIVKKSPNMVEIPNNATNGDMIKAIFPNIDTEQIEDIIDVYGMSKCRVTYDTDWWNAPYKAESEDKECR